MSFELWIQETLSKKNKTILKYSFDEVTQRKSIDPITISQIVSTDIRQYIPIDVPEDNEKYIDDKLPSKLTIVYLPRENRPTDGKECVICNNTYSKSHMCRIKLNSVTLPVHPSCVQSFLSIIGNHHSDHRAFYTSITI